MKITVDLTRFTKIQHNSEFLKSRDAIKNPLGKCFYPEGASRGRIYNWLTNPDGGGGGHLSWSSPGTRTCQRKTEAFSRLAKRSKVKQKGKTGLRFIYSLLEDKNIVLLFKVPSF